MTVKTWNPNNGDLLQGDVILFKVPSEVIISKNTEIKAKDNRLILAEGEITGHHHAIYFYRANEGDGDFVGTQVLLNNVLNKKVGVAKLYQDDAAIQKLIKMNELISGSSAVGFLVVEDNSVELRHDEHDAIKIPPGSYYVGNQLEWSAEQARKAKD